MKTFPSDTVSSDVSLVELIKPKATQSVSSDSSDDTEQLLNPEKAVTFRGACPPDVSLSNPDSSSNSESSAPPIKKQEVEASSEDTDELLKPEKALSFAEACRLARATPDASVSSNSVSEPAASASSEAVAMLLPPSKHLDVDSSSDFADEPLLNELIEQSNGKTYRISTRLLAHNAGAKLRSLRLILPIPTSNQYQTISDITVNGVALSELDERDKHSTITVSAQGDRYIEYVTPAESLPAKDQSMVLCVQYDAKLFDIDGHLERVGDDEDDSDTKESANAMYLLRRDENECVDCEHAGIGNLSEYLWRKAASKKRRYVELCFAYVCGHFACTAATHKDEAMLDRIFEDSAGDHTDLTVVLVNLLRSQGVASRYLSGILVTGRFHVWCEFKLPARGWFPLVVLGKARTAKFGAFKRFGVALHRNLHLAVPSTLRESGADFVDSRCNFAYFEYSSLQMVKESDTRYKMENDRRARTVAIWIYLQLWGRRDTREVRSASVCTKNDDRHKIHRSRDSFSLRHIAHAPPPFGTTRATSKSASLCSVSR